MPQKNGSSAFVVTTCNEAAGEDVFFGHVSLQCPVSPHVLHFVRFFSSMMCCRRAWASPSKPFPLLKPLPLKRPLPPVFPEKELRLEQLPLPVPFESLEAEELSLPDQPRARRFFCMSSRISL